MWKLTFEKITHMQLMWSCICSSRQCEETCKNKYLKKSLTCNYCGDWRRFESKCANSHLRKAHTCNKCEFASGQVGDLRKHVKTKISENRSHATIVTLHLFKQAIWEHMWKYTFKKMTHMQLMWHCIIVYLQSGNLRRRLEIIMEKFRTSAIIVTVQAGDFRGLV